MKHSELVEIAYGWVLRNAGCGFAFKELRTTASEIPDVIGFGVCRSVVVEAKVSRADFLKDKKKFCRTVGKGVGKYRFYICPEGLIKVEELPAGWGLIYVNEKGRARCVNNPYNSKGGNIWYNNPFEVDLEEESRIMYSALRRLHLKGYMETIYDKQYIYDG